ncbi:hypothetical protein CDAR_365001, partial [Caerostris darwini]
EPKDRSLANWRPRRLLMLVNTCRFTPIHKIREFVDYPSVFAEG